MTRAAPNPLTMVSCLQSSSKSLDKNTKEALSARPLKEQNDEDSKAMGLSFMTSLKACAKNKDLNQGSRIHADIGDSGLLEKNTCLGNMLVNMYAKCGALVKAQQVLDDLPVRNVVSWTALVVGYVQHGQGKEALGCFYQMRNEGLSPNVITYVCILKACGITQEVDIGEQLHGEIISQGLLENNVELGSVLVDMYAKCGNLAKAQKVLDELPVRNVISWSALIAGYVQQGQSQEAIDCFQRMQSDDICPDAITYSCTLDACGITQDMDMGKKIHDEIVSQELLEKEVALGSALVDMYAKCGDLAKAQKVLDGLLVRNVISWSALIAGYAQRGQGQEALGCFQRMQSEGFSPNAHTYTCILKACGIMQDIEMGAKFHEEIASQGLLDKDVVLGNALIDMYAKCGVLAKAQNVFNKLPIRDVTSWNALISGYAQQGQGQEALSCFQRMQSEGFSPDLISWNAVIGGYSQQGLAKEALEMFEWMQEEGISPDEISFANLLNACSHSGLVDEGEMYFDNMREKYGITPDKQHCTCMVDLFGRARRFDKAMRVIKMMPSSDYVPVWSALLGACQKWGNVKLGEFAFERATQLDGCKAALYASMINIYAAAGMKEEAQNIERMRIKNAAWKQQGQFC